MMCKRRIYPFIKQTGCLTVFAIHWTFFLFLLNFKQSLSVSLEVGAQRELKLEEQPSRKEKKS